ncbi:acetyl-CoA carboxylase biotin carboxyl carrier protein subunit [Sphaerisporangium album]|uniref:Biotin carboxyl carrier protein of acetyl-CoA carboxylase n=1 Tax=Sphaerisporangium album TaxID=509200 RepID=A0A367F909_9ACTN|nr:biotin/lipoyl-containing protein [Sphaerisporangium album]RCG26848.1 acetyl-CoA carboxylase biotin carboxyl carrier protein subunit [Sphaerisporangium album]
MTPETTGEDEREQVLDWVVRHTALLGSAGQAPLRRITVSTATLAIDVQWSPPPGPAPGVGGQHDTGHAHPLEFAGAPPDTTAGTRSTGGTVLVTAPMVGTFYRAREPGAPPFVQVGDLVEAGQQVGVIEAMKLMNAVQAEHAGRVSEIVAEDGTPVQYEEPLLALVPCDAH